MNGPLQTYILAVVLLISLAGRPPVPGSGPSDFVAVAAAAGETIPFWERFVTSAGAGGLAALAAAIIAAIIARQQLKHTKEQQRHDRWWDTLSWVYDRAVVDAEKKESLPHRVTFTVLTELNRQALAPPVDRLQEGTIESILSMFSSSEAGPAGSGDHVAEDTAGANDSIAHDPEAPSSGLEVSDPVAIDLMQQLKASVEQARSARGDSPTERARRYEGELGTALERLPVTVTAARHSSYPFDFLVERERSRCTYVDAAAGLSTDRLYVSLARLHSFLNESPREAIAVMVTDSDLTSTQLREVEKFNDQRIRTVTWRDRRDDDALLAAVKP